MNIELTSILISAETLIAANIVISSILLFVVSFKHIKNKHIRSFVFIYAIWLILPSYFLTGIIVSIEDRVNIFLRKEKSFISLFTDYLNDEI
jgi:hypothetical protein